MRWLGATQCLPTRGVSTTPLGNNSMWSSPHSRPKSPRQRKRMGGHWICGRLLQHSTPSCGLGVVDFSIFPHLDNPALVENTPSNADRWAAFLQGPAYAIDDQTAIKVADGTVEVVSEGHWKLFTP